MRYNLKNFPDVHHFDVESCAKMHRWKEGFERELREMIPTPQSRFPNWSPYELVTIKLIREVLGE